PTNSPAPAIAVMGLVKNAAAFAPSSPGAAKPAMVPPASNPPALPKRFPRVDGPPREPPNDRPSRGAAPARDLPTEPKKEGLRPSSLAERGSRVNPPPPPPDALPPPPPPPNRFPRPGSEIEGGADIPPPPPAAPAKACAIP